ncbi:hypothetical protein FEI14_06720 [Lacticaseibacillus zeae]|uniref:Uncharacterized protein n=1 Tax=Lacticaseibacillus zeae TaxID=57037 RepID=A0A5R8LXC3_LACZE|nr:hypothetical protein FEI14_06720 [Lacticaseibacillus zeae]
MPEQKFAYSLKKASAALITCSQWQKEFFVRNIEALVPSGAIGGQMGSVVPTTFQPNLAGDCGVWHDTELCAYLF